MMKLPARSLAVLAGGLDVAFRGMLVDVGVHPKNPALIIVGDLGRLRGMRRPWPVFVFDPLARLGFDTWREYEHLKSLGFFRDWSEAEWAAVREQGWAE